MTATERACRTITIHPGLTERLLAMRDKATKPLLDCDQARTREEAGRLVHEAALTYHSLLSGLVDLLTAAHEPDTQLTIEPYNEFSIGFCRTSGYHGGLLWHEDEHRFQIHT